MRKFLSRVPYWPFLIVPAAAYGLGFLLNEIVISINNGQMPVLSPGGCSSAIAGVLFTEDDYIHSCMTGASHLKFLSDWIIIKGMGIASPGDFLIWGGDRVMWPALIIWATLVIKSHMDSTE